MCVSVCVCKFVYFLQVNQISGNKEHVSQIVLFIFMDSILQTCFSIAGELFLLFFAVVEIVKSVF